MSIVIPCRNEEGFIGKCLDSIVANEFPKERLEVLVVDGMSEDGTRPTLDRYARQYSFIKVLDNPKKITPTAFNVGVRYARGDLVMIMSAHATIAKDAIAKCVEYSELYNADNVGGSWKIVPRDSSFVARTIAVALSHPFGVGNARYRMGSGGEPRWVDTAAYGCYRREVFQRVGLFNEKLVRGQDMEFNLRLKKSGGRTLLAPDIVICYYARSDMRAFWKHNWTNGVWAILPFLYSNTIPVSVRHLVPLAFVMGLLGSVVLALVWPGGGGWLLSAICGAYAVANLTASVQVAVKERDFRYMVLIPIVFAGLHLSYGLGSLSVLIKVMAHICSDLIAKG